MKRILLLTVLVAALVCSCKRQPEHITVIVSMDGFRWDYPELYETPWLDSIGRAGVTAEMLPSYPASTFPNHYTLATGLVPDHHGIVNNVFWDSELGVQYGMGDTLTRNNPKYYGGEPIWNTAERQGVRTANIYWVGSDICIGGRYPSRYLRWYDTPRLDYAGRVDEALRILSLPEAERPAFLMVYFDDPDASGHHYGPRSEGCRQAVESLDSLMGVFYRGIRALPYGDKINLILTSDHGMTEISEERFINVDDVLNPAWYERVVAAAPSSIYTREGCRDSVLTALAGVPHLQAWPKEAVPAELNYGTSPNLGDVIAAPDLGWQFAYKPRNNAGAHGFSPLERDMHVIFRACGPDFQEGYVLPETFSNTAVYPLLCRLLGVKPSPNDGDLTVAGKMLR